MIKRYLVCTYNVLVGNLGHVRQGLLLIVALARRVVVAVREEEQGLQGGDLLEVWHVGRGSCHGSCWWWVGWKEWKGWRYLMVLVHRPGLIHAAVTIVIVQSDKQWMHILILVQLEVMVRLKTGTRLW